ELEGRVAKDQKRLKIGPTRRKEIDDIVDDFIKRTKSYDDGPDVALAMKRILLHRYAVRIARSTPSLFEEIDPDPRSSAQLLDALTSRLADMRDRSTRASRITGLMTLKRTDTLIHDRMREAMDNLARRSSAPPCSRNKARAINFTPQN